MIDYRYLKAFILTAEYSSFSKAADKLKIAQSAVSRQIKLLEESLGLELLIRSSKKIILTNKGKQLYLTASTFDQAANDIFFAEDTRPLKIGVLHGLLENWLTPITIKFYKKYTRNMTIKVDTPANLKTGIENGHFDIAFTTENIQSELVSSLSILKEKLILVSKKEIDIKKIHDYRWIIYNQDDNLYRVSKKISSSIVEVNSITTILNLVRNNVGIAVVPDHQLMPNDSLKCYELPGIKQSPVYMATLNYKKLPSYIKELTEFFTTSRCS
ncbi:MAG: LysR family transcriptional regulator [Bacteriovoracaceae bacterium]|nr:LysR family transcriptional regulator [Bacteriovoracaceae bacterium]